MPTKYQTGGLTEAQCTLIYDCLVVAMEGESAGPEPDLQRVDDLAVLQEMFGDPEAHLIALDGE